eukprot:6213567-Pleurochrysis_carterae.AAC.1
MNLDSQRSMGRKRDGIKSTQRKGDVRKAQQERVAQRTTRAKATREKLFQARRDAFGAATAPRLVRDSISVSASTPSPVNTVAYNKVINHVFEGTKESIDRARDNIDQMTVDQRQALLGALATIQPTQALRPRAKKLIRALKLKADGTSPMERSAAVDTEAGMKRVRRSSPSRSPSGRVAKRQRSGGGEREGCCCFFFVSSDAWNVPPSEFQADSLPDSVLHHQLVSRLEEGEVLEEVIELHQLQHLENRVAVAQKVLTVRSDLFGDPFEGRLDDVEVGLELLLDGRGDLGRFFALDLVQDERSTLVVLVEPELLHDLPQSLVCEGREVGDPILFQLFEDIAKHLVRYRPRLPGHERVEVLVEMVGALVRTGRRRGFVIPRQVAIGRGPDKVLTASADITRHAGFGLVEDHACGLLAQHAPVRRIGRQRADVLGGKTVQLFRCHPVLGQGVEELSRFHLREIVELLQKRMHVA